MKRFAKITLSALMLGGVAMAAATPADARVSVGIGIGIPGPAYYGPGYYDDYYSPCADPNFRYWHPRACGYPVYYAPHYYGSYGWYGGYHRYGGGWRGHDRDDRRGGGGHWHHH
ncbi:MAG TPA: hypothetical protein VGT78_02650 [Rhizomicrobium sp.]|nr:hypothetical protein [Rhizomicrobium sp.]